VLQFPTRAFDWVTCLGQNRPRDYGKHEFTIPIEYSIRLFAWRNLTSPIISAIHFVHLLEIIICGLTFQLP